MLPALHHNQLADITTNNQNSPRQSPTQSVNKRSSSMIFRIEHLIPSTSIAPTSSAATGERTMEISPPKKSKTVRAGVHVMQPTPRDTISEALEVQSLINCSASTETTARAYCTITKKTGVLSLTPSVLRKIKLSEDTHSNNAMFEVNRGRVVLRILRDLQTDDEIVAWFGEEITLLMSIPFLTPLNIQGNSRYTCHLCSLTFETPNPLKIHLALGCGRHNIDILWIRLYYAIKASSHYTQHMLPLSLPPPPSTAPATQLSPALPPSSTASASVSPPHSPQPSVSRFSAFKPICSSASASASAHHHHQIKTTISSIMAPSLSVPSQHAATTPLSFLPSMSSGALPHMSLLQAPTTSPLNAAAQIEAIVSNMGASKQGHLCIYCGKVYSRKYGLKIHIRTHTGFKPLKCKFCLRPFGDPSNLNKHVRLHLQNSANNSSSEGFQCNLCNKTLGRRRDLQKHMETRHGYGSAAASAEAKLNKTNSN